MKFTCIEIISKVGQGVIFFFSIPQPEVIVPVSFIAKSLSDSRAEGYGE